MAKLAAKRAKARNRKGLRYARVGREFEVEVARILQKMCEERLLCNFVRHPPRSAEDHDGRDFTVTALVGAEEKQQSFGVTISYNSWTDAKVKHPYTRQFCFPIGTKPETIRKRILELFAA